MPEALQIDSMQASTRPQGKGKQFMYVTYTHTHGLVLMCSELLVRQM